MASVSARLAVIGENGLAETDQDANSALTELDKGLRSTKVGEQCEAIVRFPRLFEKYPFPILINSACLKLAEVFRLGTNFLRVLVLRVMQQSEKHLDKILNIDEFVKRIYSVIYSNDPVARALTLRTLGSIACIVSERKNIHHSIRNCLDSHDAVELEAAIFAAGRFAAQSKTFASNICMKIGDMIQGLGTLVDMKLKLLAVFQHMHHDAQTAAVVHKLCTALLPSYPSQQLVQVTLHTLTKLVSYSITGISQQVDLLIHYLCEDPRCGVKNQVLKDLKLLAEKGSHLWTTNNIEAIVNYALKTPYSGQRCGAMSVLVTLAKSVAMDKFDLSGDCPVLQLCRESAFHSTIQMSSVAIQLLTQIALYAFQEDILIDGADLTQEASSAIEALLLITCTQGSGNELRIQALRNCLQCAISLCEVNPDLCSQFVDVLGSLAVMAVGEFSMPLCAALCALGNRRAGVMTCLMPDLIVAVAQLSSQSVIAQDNSQAVVMACTLLFQAAVDRSWSPQDSELILKALKGVNMWEAYRVARQATRYGHHQVASAIFFHLSNKVSFEHHHFWLLSLWELCQAESCIQGGGKGTTCIEESLTLSITHYMKAVSALKAATTPAHSLLFQREYAALRSEVLQTYFQLVQACSCMRTSPPPAIAQSVALATRDELQKCGRVVTQLRKCAKDFHYLADQYGLLYQSVFDADAKTLNNIQVLQQSCLLAAQAIERISQYNQGIGFTSGLGVDEVLNVDTTHQGLENYRLLEACRHASMLTRDLSKQYDRRVVERKEIDTLLMIARELMQAPLCLPRFFFQRLQSTSIKLAISPQPKVAGDPIIVHCNSNLAVKVEGVIQHGIRPGLFRKVAKVLITVSSSLQSRTSAAPDTKATGDSNNLMTQMAIPHNDYFQAQFLLAFPHAGLHAVLVEAAVVDEKTARWKTGPKMTLMVKSHDDANSPRQQPSQASSTSRVAVIAWH